MKDQILILLFSSAICSSFGQKPKTAYYFDNPVVADSSSTIIIPTRYNSDFLSANKMPLWGDFYANIVFYDFIADTYKRLFEKDTYIISFINHSSYYYDRKQQKNNTSQWYFYRVKNVDRNKSGRIDNNDPAILYVSDLHGNNPKALTSENENVLSVDLFERQNFALVKIQRDQDADGDFENEDKDFYFVKLDLTTMVFGNKIEVK